MSSINSSAYYSVGGNNSGSQGISGLMSGMDTEEMVEQMLAGTQGKIDKQEALKLQTTWKQDVYRDVIETINSFQTKFFNMSYGSSSKNNLASNDFFNNMLSAVTSGNAVKVLSSSSSAISGDMRIAIDQLATTSKVESDIQLSDHKIDGFPTGKAPDGSMVPVLSDESLKTQFSKDVVLNIGTEEVPVNLNNVANEQEMVDRFNTALSGKGVTAKVFEGKLRFVSDDPDTKITVNPKSSELGRQMTGLETGQFHYIDQTDSTGAVTGKILQASYLDMDAGRSLDLTLDGVTKTIHISEIEGGITADNLLKTLKKEVKGAFGDYVSVDMSPASPTTEPQFFTFGVNIKDSAGKVEAGHELRITGSDASVFGIASGSSSRFNMSEKISDLGAGDRFSFTINDVDFTFDGDMSVSKMVNEINNSAAGVKVSYSTMSDTMKIESSSSGSKFGVNINQTEGDILTKLFGIDAADSVVADELTTATVDSGGTGLDPAYTAEGGASMNMNVNGTNYIFNLPTKYDIKGEPIAHTQSEIDTELNSWLKATFKTDNPDGTGTPNISYANGKLTTVDGFAIRFEATSTDLENGGELAEAKKTDLGLAYGFTLKDTNNIATADTAIADVLQFTGTNNFKQSNGTTADTLGQIGLNGLSFSGGRMVFKGSSLDTSTDPNLAAAFGTETITLGGGATTEGAAGVDAILWVNGEKTTRSSNTVTIDGITMELTSVSPKDETATTGHMKEETVIATSRDDDQIVDGMKEFVEEYNAMIDKLNDLVEEDASYKEYPPLTTAQRKEMSESEIKLWDEKSKVGLVRNDSNISDFMSNMRAVIYTKPEGSDFALYQIGIETTADYEDKGKLQLNEEALRKTIATDPDGVRQLFTDTTDGISAQLVDVMERTAKESSADPGILVQSAGVKGKGTEKNNEMYRRLLDIEGRLENLNRKYELERTRYWNDFTKMESVLSGYNSQSSMLSQQFGGY